jgi:hypothetical protein
VGLDPVMAQTFDMVQKWGRKRCRARDDCQAIVERKLDLIRQSLLAQSLGAVQDRYLHLKHGTKR